MTFHGLLTALVTPFDGGVVDEACFRSLVRRQIAGGVDGLVPCGTTGEAPTLTVDEHVDVVRWAVEEAKGSTPVMAGIGSNCTATAIATAKRVEGLGVEGVLATAPYYNKPTQEGLYQHFKAIAEAVGVEVCLYDVPGRSVVHIEPATVARLSEIENITAVKDATGDMSNAIDVRRRCGDQIALLSGDDFTTLPFLALGGDGVISVASNVVPEAMSSLVSAVRGGRLEEARPASEMLFPLFQALFYESNPIPVKAAMAQLGLLKNELRLPLTPMSPGPKAALLEILAGH
jgi:4-hydroxy-tetrahydrodipicolinate synthase